jgi:hypothetical protein
VWGDSVLILGDRAPSLGRTRKETTVSEPATVIKSTTVSPKMSR